MAVAARALDLLVEPLLQVAVVVEPVSSSVIDSCSGELVELRVLHRDHELAGDRLEDEHVVALEQDGFVARRAEDDLEIVVVVDGHARHQRTRRPRPRARRTQHPTRRVRFSRMSTMHSLTPIMWRDDVGELLGDGLDVEVLVDDLGDLRRRPAAARRARRGSGSPQRAPPRRRSPGALRSALRRDDRGSVDPAANIDEHLHAEEEQRAVELLGGGRVPGTRRRRPRARPCTRAPRTPSRSRHGVVGRTSA